jgi:cobalamin biosynthesis protein CobT
MNKEVEFVDDSQEKKVRRGKKEAYAKTTPSGFYSVDDIEFDDPEYLEMSVREKIKSKRDKELQEEKDDNIQHSGRDEDETNINEEKASVQDSSEEGESNDEEDSENDSGENREDDEEGENQTNGENKKTSSKLNTSEKTLDELMSTYTKLFEQLVGIHEADEEKRNPNLLKKSINKCAKEIYQLLHKYGKKSSSKELSQFVQYFRLFLKELNENYEKQSVGDRRFPPMNIVIIYANQT